MNGYTCVFIFSENYLIVIIGQDGLSNTAKYSKGIPKVAVNPDKKDTTGISSPMTRLTLSAVSKVLFLILIRRKRLSLQKLFK
ncbi:MAG TPA: hypothetical protein VF691_10100 [Cytophagaceae bacterium]